MKRLYLIIKKELNDVRESLPFYVIVTLVPVVFMLLWTVLLTEEIALPVTLAGVQTDPNLANHLRSYATPGGIRYFKVTSEENPSENKITIKKALTSVDGILTGEITHEFRSIDVNMTKNYRNRLTGAVLTYIDKNYLKNRAIVVNEKPVHKKDILWKNYFAASLLVMGILMAGLLYGSLSLAKEWIGGTELFLSISPRSCWWVLAGKETAIIAKGLVTSCVYLLMALLIVPDFHLQPVGVLIMFSLGYWLIGMTGMIVGIVVRDVLNCFLISLLSALFLWLLGNGFGTMAITGVVGGFITSINPATYLAGISQHFINGTAIDWILTLKVLASWLFAAHVSLYILYRRKVYKPRGVI
jgi:ABC-2 type transport system permease protein